MLHNPIHKLTIAALLRHVDKSNIDHDISFYGKNVVFKEQATGVNTVIDYNKINITYYELLKQDSDDEDYAFLKELFGICYFDLKRLVIRHLNLRANDRVNSKSTYTLRVAININSKTHSRVIEEVTFNCPSIDESITLGEGYYAIDEIFDIVLRILDIIHEDTIIFKQQWDVFDKTLKLDAFGVAIYPELNKDIFELLGVIDPIEMRDLKTTEHCSTLTLDAVKHVICINTDRDIEEYSLRILSSYPAVTRGDYYLTYTCQEHMRKYLYLINQLGEKTL